MIDFKKIDTIANLLFAGRERTLTDDEKSELDEWLKEDPGNQILFNSLKKEKKYSGPTKNFGRV